ncbi:MAG: right-handed parallel beta-helix repeat-containing protein [Thermoleophilia bacterium]|nr:right-handed parallel beta-helix repeat-containing protein [Thermoleophilia bacterium]MDH3725676.1 right-handed parallel beta-helix repeat-containing protein [Thermoleophilia bacterium]
MIWEVVVAIFAALVPAAAPDVPADTRVLHVADKANEDGDGTRQRPFDSVQAALRTARPGDEIVIGPGTYREQITTVRAGTPTHPIRIRGRKATIKGEAEDQDRLVSIRHDYIELRSLRFERADKLVWLDGVTGVRLIGNTLTRAGGECLRIRNRSQGNEIVGNVIRKCGEIDFDPADGEKNGEAIYIGTAPEQRGARRPDASSSNLIRRNRVDTPGECIDIKEGATANIIRGNTCRGTEDPDSGAISVRGSLNVLSANTIEDSSGAGIRLGGDGLDDGVGNVVQRNTIRRTEGFGLKLTRGPQLVCGNRFEAISGGERGGDHADDLFNCEVP